MAENNANEQVPRWQSIQNEQIQRATNLIKEHGSNVEFVVVKDRIFLNETINPLLNIDSAMNYLYRLEGRGIDSKDISKFKTDYLELVKKISDVESMAVKLLAGTNVRTDSRFLNRKLQIARKKEKKEKK